MTTNYPEQDGVEEEFNELMLKAKYWEGFLDGKLAGMEEYERLQKPGYALAALLKLAHPPKKGKP